LGVSFLRDSTTAQTRAYADGVWKKLRQLLINPSRGRDVTDMMTTAIVVPPVNSPSGASRKPSEDHDLGDCGG
jgi:hypothetical protein